MNYISFYNSPVGKIVLCSDGEYLTGLWFDSQKKYSSLPETEGAKHDDSLCVFADTKAWLNKYFRSENPGKIPPVKLTGTDFRMKVWNILKEIPYGESISYGEIAHLIAEKCGKEKMSAQAVGGAVGHNPVGIIIPCHRVLGADKSLTGYAGGIDIKRKLLELENIEYCE